MGNVVRQLWRIVLFAHKTRNLVQQTAPSPLVFGVVWTLLYALNTFAGASFVARHDEARVSDLFSVTLVFYLVNVALNKAWTPLFFGAQRACLALIDLVFVLATAIVVLVLFGYTGAWVAFGLYVPYIVWLFVALVLNIRFIAADESPLR